MLTAGDQAAPPDAGAADAATTGPRSRPRGHTTRQLRRRRRKMIRKARRTVFGRHPLASGFLACVLALTPLWISIGSALDNPSDGSSLAARAAEWTRLHGGSAIVAWAETLWYSHEAPPVGGKPAKGAIPPPPAATVTIAAKAGVQVPAHLPAPAPIVPLASPALAGEGLWHPVGRRVDGLPAVYEAFLRPDAVHTSLVIGVAWMDTDLLRAALYSGSTIPGGGPYPLTAPIEPAAAKSLVAAFNSGFLMNDSRGGYYTDRRAISPLLNGAASLVIYRNGKATVGDWGTEVKMTPEVVAVRQNAGMLVDHGAPVPGLNANDTTVWGYTVGNQVYVWRSGVGVTADGALVYVAGPGLNITTLANMLVRAGCVRAMELDINYDWVNFSVYSPSRPGGLAAAANGTNLLQGMLGTPARYFYTWWTRDFFTMSAR